ncbi:histone-lysine N-methyltransferase ASHH2-like [Heracleum sosnowskyi]|uniref:Histone-lysine N-methyltransferase ASHH2-like n=1 Tax=Heracleum sosnowskyi TaxID=360622 RepID=A0AAD8H897_9APIA|nr:histone-lysine N-methyltransferase ASHH2-like [Heracleum sosnowskyi]
MVNEMGLVGEDGSGWGEIVSKESREGFSAAEGGCKRTVVVALSPDGNAGILDNVRPRRSNGRKNKVEEDVVGSGESMMTASGRPSRKCKKISDGKVPSDLSFFEFVGTGRRSLFCKPRVSDWGSMESIDHVFGQIADADLNRDEDEKLREVGGLELDFKLKSNQRRARSQRSKKEIPASTSRIRLKVTFGRSCSSDIISGVVNDHRSSCHNQIKSPKCTEDITKKFEEGICSAPDGHDEVATQKQVELLEAVDSRCLEPGTSPDSEVINMIPDSQTSEKIAEDDFLDKEICAVSGEVSSSTLPVASSRKGIKKNIPCQDFNCSTDDKPPSPEIIDSTRVADQHRHFQRTTNDAILSEPYMSITTGNNKSAKTSSSGVSFVEPPFQSSGVPDFGDSANETKKHCSAVRSQHESSEKCVPSTKPKDHINIKSSGSPNSRLECSQAMPTEAGSDEQKRDLSDLKAIEKSDHVQAVCKSEIYAKTGSHTFIDHEESKNGCSITQDVTPIKLNGAQDEYAPPRNAWVSCDSCYKWRRIPATLADSIEDTKSSWICKDNADKDFADCSIPQEKSNAEINAELDISDASCEEDVGADLHESDRLEKKKATVSKQSSWKLIRSNHFLHRTRKTQTIDEIMVCHCKATLGGRMGCGNGCLNRMLNIECVKGTCPCGELCSNNQFQKRNYANLKCFRSGKKGRGLQLLEDIREGQFLIEYVGEVLDMHAYEARQKEYALKGHKHFYFMTLNGSEVIDACIKGNLGRFINHSCEPNCRTEKWMVNGEVCIGLFALRDIKKGEEMTFDYNYVRVFGAAAKKCLCGSSICRGYIGGDPTSDEIIVQDDSDEEISESVVVCEDSDDNLDNMVSTSSSVDIDVMNMSIVEKDVGGKAASYVENSEAVAEMHAPCSLSRQEKENRLLRTAAGCTMMSRIDESVQKSSSSDQDLLSVVEMDSKAGLTSSMQTDTSMQLDDGKSSIILVCDEISNKSLETTQSSENLTTKLSRSSIEKTDIQRKCKYENEESRNVFSASPLIPKTSHSPPSLEKIKLQKSDVLVKNPEMGKKLHQLPYKSNKLVDSSSRDPFEAVQVKLNKLLNAEGGISKRKDASKGYLKLLFLTAASGDSGNGEGIQSNRDLSMILDALLKTQSRTVLADIINKNGLQMLHNIMKRCRKEFHKIPILRKLVKVIEYLAVREILTLEHITTGPTCVGVESFSESILSLTEHEDKQVHKIARSFRDKWIPRHIRRNYYMDRDTGRMDINRGPSNCNRLSALHSQSFDVGERRPESVECIEQPKSGDKIDCENFNSCSGPCSSDSVANKTRVGKRKSRFEQPAESSLGIGAPPHKEPRIHPESVHISKLQRHGISCVWSNQDAFVYEKKHTNRSVNCSPHRTKTRDLDGNGQNINGDVPSGFSSPQKDSLVSSGASSTAKGLQQEKCFCPEYPYEVVVGQAQERFISKLPVSFGIPLHVVEQFGRPVVETAENWVVVAGIPFHPYPPLPSYARERRGPTPASSSLTKRSDAVVREDFQNCATYQSDQNAYSTSTAAVPDLEHSSPINQHNMQGTSGASNYLERRYFRQQKWSNTKLSPPWIRSRLGGGNFGYSIGWTFTPRRVCVMLHQIELPFCVGSISIISL